MDILELCDKAGFAVQRGGRDLWGHVYEPGEFHFGFQIEDYVLCFRYRTWSGTEGWFLNVSPGESDSALTFTRISEIDVTLAVTLFLEYRQRLSRSAKPQRKPQQQMMLFHR
jgi:hypothetical protein